MNTIQQQIQESISVKQALLADSALMDTMETVARLIVQSYKSGHKTMWAGNGGSAADAQHMAGELVNKFTFDRPGLAALSLSTDTSIITDIGNDYGFSPARWKRKGAQEMCSLVFPLRESLQTL